MPVYELHCSKCGPVDRYCSYAERDKQKCDTCGSQLIREGLDAPTIGKPSFQSGAVLSSGEKIAGNFKTARKKGGWHRP